MGSCVRSVSDTWATFASKHIYGKHWKTCERLLQTLLKDFLMIFTLLLYEAGTLLGFYLEMHINMTEMH